MGQSAGGKCGFSGVPSFSLTVTKRCAVEGAFEYRYCQGEEVRVYQIPKGFETGFGMFQKWSRRWIFPTETGGRPATPAAVLYAWVFHNTQEKNQEARRVFRQALKMSGVAWWVRWIVRMASRG